MWLGMVEPKEGLVVSVAALLEADCYQRLTADDHKGFVEMLEAASIEPRGEKSETPRKASAIGSEHPFIVSNLRELLVDALEWPEDLYEQSPPDDLCLDVPEGNQTVRPTAVLYSQRGNDEQIRLLIWEIPRDLPFDDPETETGDWDYAPAKKFERLLREVKVPIGLLFNGRALRLIYAPAGEASGHIDFRVPDMAEPTGRPIFEAFVMLLDGDRVLHVAEDRKLHAILKRSREMQGEVTTELSRQVFGALELLLKGFEAADHRANGSLLRPVMQREGPYAPEFERYAMSQAEGEGDVVSPHRSFGGSDTAKSQKHSGDDPLYEGLLTVLLRLVFLLYAEDSVLLPTEHPLFSQHYSIYGLFERLERERGLYPDAMDRRHAAWPSLLALFRAVYLGVEHGDFKLPPREGHLFDPHRYPFLEGFESESVPVRDVAAQSEAQVPTLDDETVYLVLQSLIYLKGARLSYRALQVEQVGSVYEGLMGYRTERVVADAVRIKPSDSKTAPQWLSVETLLEVKPAQREKWLKESIGLKGKRAKEMLKDIKKAEADLDGEELGNAVLARLEEERVKGSSVARVGRIVIQPGEERKRTSSHYTPQSLSGPIVARALEPLLKCFGDVPTSEQILSLKVCDPAMGSGAFLVEACRYLGERLVDAWRREGRIEDLKQDEDPLIAARRQIAERCLYGVDKNPFAVELGKLSLWLVTLSKEKPFTFLDHTLRCGDSLVGCSLEQITAFDWKAGVEDPTAKDKGKKKRKKKQEPAQMELRFDEELKFSLEEAIEARQLVEKLSPEDTPEANRQMRVAMDDADDALKRLRLIGDLLIGAFFSEKKDKARDKERLRRKELILAWLNDETSRGIPTELAELAAETRRTLRPFHWMIEFPEVFYAGRPDPLTGQVASDPAYLDAVIGNPPFATMAKIAEGHAGQTMFQWLVATNPGDTGVRGKCDLCAFFFRLGARLLAAHGTLGLIATNTISQGDTRSIGLQHLLALGARVYDANVSMPWPGDAGVRVSTVHVSKGDPSRYVGALRLDGHEVSEMNSRLRPVAERADPVVLSENGATVFQGNIVLGEGFLLTPDERDELVTADPRNVEVLFPYVGGADLNASPSLSNSRFTIDFASRSLEEAREWPDVLRILELRVKPQREGMKAKSSTYDKARVEWWKFFFRAPALRSAVAGLGRCLAISQVSKHLLFAFQPTERVLANTVYAFALPGFCHFSILQSRVHERWARLLSSSLEDRLRYTASDCFETFPFPRRSPKEVIPELEKIGEELYETRAKFMVDTDQGLTKTYNALKDPTVTARSEHGERIEHLRQLHIDMDRAVLEAYARETNDPTWTDIEIPPFTDPVTDAEKELHQKFEDRVLDKLFELNEIRSRV